jgi:predicted nuclease with TOPRIM domain
MDIDIEAKLKEHQQRQTELVEKINQNGMQIDALKQQRQQLMTEAAMLNGEKRLLDSLAKVNNA